MSIDQYSRHNDDVESGLAPSQGEQPADWPKKIRSLSTDDLDRLTIDSAGRFYWDGQLVNYGFAKPDGQLIDARELSSLASPHKETTTTGGTAMAEPAKQTDATLDAIAEALAAATPAPAETPTVIVAPPVAGPTVSASPYVSAAAMAPTEPAPVSPSPVATASAALVATTPQTVNASYISPAGPNTEIVLSMPDEPRRLRLSFFQSLGALLLVLSVLLGGIGLAASGLTVALEYGCRAGLVTAYCPKPPPAPARPPRGIID